MAAFRGLTANAVQRALALGLGSGLVALGAAAFATDWIGPLPTNVAHGLILNVGPGVIGLAAWRFRFASLYLALMAWGLVAVAVYGFLDGPRWMYPFFHMTDASSVAELIAGLVVGLVHYGAPELLPARRRPDPEDMKMITLEGAEVAYVDYGDGEPVLFLHGYPQNMLCWWAQIERLRHDHRVIAMDFPGWGRSRPAPDRPPSVQDDVERVRGLLDSLGIASVNLITHDYGGFVGLTFVQRYPERVRRFAISNSRAHSYFPPLLALPTAVVSWIGRTSVLRVLGCLLPWEGIHHAGMLKYVRRDCFGHDDIDDYQAPLVPWRGRAWLMAMFAGYPTRALDELRQRLPDVGCPTAVIWGDADPYCPIAIAEELAAAIPNATLRRLEGAEHFAIEERTEETTEALRALLRRELAATPGAR